MIFSMEYYFQANNVINMSSDFPIKNQSYTSYSLFNMSALLSNEPTNLFEPVNPFPNNDIKKQNDTHLAVKYH